VTGRERRDLVFGIAIAGGFFLFALVTAYAEPAIARWGSGLP
jgi:glycosyltransferase A (GT-A) superfamily protein (DUF2064 family)